MKLPISPSASPDGDPLAARLCADGLANAPEFSPELHAHIMTALREKGLKLLSADEGAERKAAEAAGKKRWSMAWKIAAPLAAAAAIAVVVWMRQTPPPPSASEQLVKDFHTILPDQVFDSVKHAEDTLEEGKYGYLDKDAQRLAVFVADQIPSLNLPDPSPRK